MPSVMHKIDNSLNDIRSQSWKINLVFADSTNYILVTTFGADTVSATLAVHYKVWQICLNFSFHFIPDWPFFSRVPVDWAQSYLGAFCTCDLLRHRRWRTFLDTQSICTGPWPHPARTSACSCRTPWTPSSWPPTCRPSPATRLGQWGDHPNSRGFHDNFKSFFLSKIFIKTKDWK